MHLNSFTLYPTHPWLVYFILYLYIIPPSGINGPWRPHFLAKFFARREKKNQESPGDRSHVSAIHAICIC